ncbi:unnamed protein product [Vicia faba]|uniref:Uncharacterized protein n=1 Tax=Vicia faba TaxID=3906 RepID=A0AAV1AKD9_VICFA|nr:unnamed protein product [Vicia faba]
MMQYLVMKSVWLLVLSFYALWLRSTFVESFLLMMQCFFCFYCNAVMRQLYCLGSLLLLGSGVGAVWGGTAFTSLIWQGRRNPRWIKAEMIEDHERQEKGVRLTFYLMAASDWSDVSVFRLSPLNLFGLMYFGGSAVCVSKALVGFM